MRTTLRILGVLLLILVAWERWRVLGPDKEPPFWERWRQAPAKARVWTDVSGRSIEAVPLATDDSSVQLRVLATQTVHSVPLERLSEPDREFVARWRTGRSVPPKPEPSPPDRWPAEFAGRAGVSPTPAGDTAAEAAKIWRTPGYELRDFANLDADTVRTLAAICESIDGACQVAPLPMLWGRPDGKRRTISIHPDERRYLAAGGLPGSAGCFVPHTGEVLVCGPELRESDFLGMARGFTLEKRKRYSVLVHELVHQASLGITLAGFPAWVPEGLAEYFAAIQRTPGRFDFRNSHLAVKSHVVASLGYDGLVELESYPLWTLDRFLERDLAEWNRITAKQTRDDHSLIQYLQAVVLMEYFCRGDSPEGRRFRSYLEAVLTGASPNESARLHLLAGRSHAELERAVADYWKPRGLTLDFTANPSMKNAAPRLGIGVKGTIGQ